MGKFATDPFQDASKEQGRLRLALMGTSGSGKTWTALKIACELAALDGGKVAFLDTEGKSSLLYSRDFKFRVMHLQNNYNPALYVNAIEAAADFGYSVLVIDSLTHAWNGAGGVLDIVDAAGAKMGGNKWAGWSKGRPAQNALVNTIINSPLHIIATMRSKTEWQQQENPRTKKMEPVKVGLAAVQSDDLEYEFTIAGMLDIDHNLTLTKSRFSTYPTGSIVNVDNFVTDVHQWLNDGTEPESPIEIVGTPAASESEASMIDGETGEVIEDQKPNTEADWPTWFDAMKAAGFSAYNKTDMNTVYGFDRFEGKDPVKLLETLDAYVAAQKATPAQPMSETNPYATSVNKAKAQPERVGDAKVVMLDKKTAQNPFIGSTVVHQ